MKVTFDRADINALLLEKMDVSMSLTGGDIAWSADGEAQIEVAPRVKNPNFVTVDFGSTKE